MSAYLQIGIRSFPKDEKYLGSEFYSVFQCFKIFISYFTKQLFILSASTFYTLAVRPNTVQMDTKMNKVWNLPSSLLHITDNYGESQWKNIKEYPENKRGNWSQYEPTHGQCKDVPQTSGDYLNCPGRHGVIISLSIL